MRSTDVTPGHLLEVFHLDVGDLQSRGCRLPQRGISNQSKAIAMMYPHDEPLLSVKHHFIDNHSHR